jgi:hypothetical protein
VIFVYDGKWEKMTKRVEIVKMKIFLDCEWWDNFCVWNGLRLGQIEFVKKKKRFLGYEETKQKLIIKRK